MPKLLRQHFNGAFDSENRFCYTERTAIGDTARCLVCINAIDDQMRCRDIIRAGADVHETGRPFDGVQAQASNAPWSASTCTRMPVILPSLVAAKLGGHVIIAGKPRGGKIFHPVLNPFDRNTKHD